MTSTKNELFCERRKNPYPPCPSLILSALTSFHLAEASLSAFSWLYTLVCAVVQKDHKMPFIYNYSHF